ncbi:MAG: HAD family hydrolase, partial [Athalassotoga sp.]
LVIFGDGPVEISVGKNFDAFTVGVASDEKKGYGWNLKKFQRLKDVGADLLIPDFTVKAALEKIFLHISKQKEGMK